MNANKSASDLAKACLTAWSHCLTVTAQLPKHHASLNTRLADFNLWADGVGAFASVKASLDMRLKAHPDEITTVKCNLTLLELFLQEYASLADSGSMFALDNALRDIDSSLHNLALFATAVRRSGRKSHVHKADRTFDAAEHSELRLHLQCIALLRPSAGPRGELDLAGLTPAQNRLIQANLRRRHRFLYSQRHSKRLQARPVTQSFRTGEPGNNQRPDDVPILSRTTSEGRAPADSFQTKHDKSAHLRDIDSPSTTGSGTTASVPDSKLQYAQRTRSSPSFNRSTITSFASRASYPRPVLPRAAFILFKCPCCCQPMPIKDVMEDKQWRKHIVDDLCPYTCIADNCPSPHILYRNREGWEKHVRNDHPPAWQCPLCDDDYQLFSSMAGIRIHLSDEHPQGISYDVLLAILSTSTVNTLWIEACPLCDTTGPRDSPELVDHVLGHMHDFSLRSLPWGLQVPLEPMRPVGVYNLKFQDAGRILHWLSDTDSAEAKHLELQLSPFDRNLLLQNSPGTRGAPDVPDYFADNDYFAEESKDGSMSFVTQTRDSTDQSTSGIVSASGEGSADASSPELSYKDYTVGWVCVLPVELTEATAKLDKLHPQLPKPSEDPSTYILGSIGRNNIVIACVSEGTGSFSTATVVTQMVITFTSIKLCLMVGIGSGVPPKVRLGDLVVGVPKPGTVQWDSTKADMSRILEQKGALKIPSNAVTTASAKLVTERETELKLLLSEYTLYWSQRKHLPAPDNRKSRHRRVHWGIVAFGNRITKDQVLDIINESVGGDVLCVDEQAAGLMIDFPCIVIRGIGDYEASNGVNLGWQEHAAAAAAAFAQGLLESAEPSDFEDETLAADVLAQAMDLTACSESSSSLQQADCANRRVAGTGKWLLDSGEFKTWVEGKGQTLFCPGVPGAGKTIITSVVVDNLVSRFHNDETIGIGYIYLRRQVTHDAVHLLSSLLVQVAARRPSLSDSMTSLFEEHKENLEEISQTLHSVAATYSRVFLIIDALDECQAAGGCREFLSELFKFYSKCRANIFATSRFIPEITTAFQGSITLEIRAHEQDVRRYVDRCIMRSPRIPGLSLVLLEQFKTKMIHENNGIFLLTQLCISTLGGTFTTNALRAALAKPSTEPYYDTFYMQEMQRIQGQSPDKANLAKQLLMWVTYAKRPMTTRELQCALSVKIGEPELDEDNFPPLEDMVSVCAGLVEIFRDTIRPVHYSLREHLERTREHWFPDAETDIARKLIVCLSLNRFDTEFCPTDKVNVLYEYAAKNWGHHARAAAVPMGKELKRSILEFLASEKSFGPMQIFMASTGRASYSQARPKYMTDVHYAAVLGLEEIMTALLRSSRDLDVRDTFFMTPLTYAAEFGNEAIVKLLLERGADIEAGESSQSPLVYAAVNGHEAVVKLLLGKGANPKAEDGFGQTALSLAEQNGHEAIVKLLQEKGANSEA